MTARQMTEPQIARWSRDMVNQGVRVTRTKKGLLLRLPDGSTAMKHFTESDVRGPKNLAAQLRRAGVTSPDDKKIATLPKYITEGTITAKSRDKMIQFIESHNFPTQVFSKDVVHELNMDPGQVNRMLYHCGFTVGETMGRKGRPWYTPETILSLKQQEAEGQAIPEEARSIIEGARKAQEEVDRLTAIPEPEATAEEESPAEKAFKAGVEGAREFGRNLGKAMKEAGMVPPSRQEKEVVVEKSSFHEGREFIDTSNSWALRLDDLDPTLTVAQWMSVLRAAGLEYEIRVWHP